MRFGICCSPESSSLMADFGYEFVEWPLSGTLANISEEEFQNLEKSLEHLPVRPEAWNVMLPASIKVVGPEADFEALTQYLERTFSKAARLGGEIIVFGSGKSRFKPDNWETQHTREQLIKTCMIAGDTAQKYGLRIAIEPLNRGETNTVNTTLEALDLASLVNHPNVGVLADLFHFDLEQESLQNLLAVGQTLLHVHVSAPRSRLAPNRDNSYSEMEAFFRTLHSIGYDHRISLECRLLELQDAETALTYLRALWEETS